MGTYGGAGTKTRMLGNLTVDLTDVNSAGVLDNVLVSASYNSPKHLKSTHNFVP